ncbi:hypothetical protein ALQ07_04177 [Pseudomonas syringae pv. actinidiae]|uniref:Uncharacterized protein n=1 Tax=Pseudomonas syringae pv. actinidiae TaxID=103796 RepID=A0A3M4K0P2_PSESF|nr:hypothetical protein ALQ07_04177 [Pseudomonas syringae pv. actinidiae]
MQFPPRPRKRPIQPLRTSCACDRTSSRTGKNLSSIAGHIGRRAKNLVLRISTKPCFSWARMPCATARSAAPPPVGALPTRADHGLKIFRNSQPNCRALSRYLLMMERISNRYRVYSVKAIAYAHFLQSGIPECPTHPLKLLNTAKPFCAR